MRLCNDREHAADYRPRKGKNNSADHGNRRIDPCRVRWEKMFHDDNIAVVDNHLSGKEDSRLQPVPEGNWNFGIRRAWWSELGLRKQVRHRNRSSIRRNNAPHTGAAED